MKNLLPLFASCVLLASCAGGPERAPAAPREAAAGRGPDALAPKGPGWKLVASSDEETRYSKDGKGRYETFTAQVTSFPLPETASRDEFTALIRNGVEKDMPAERFTVLRSNFAYTELRGYPCVSAEHVAEDKQARVSPTQTETLLVETVSLHCRHPVKTDTGFAAVYSHRGESSAPGLELEARDFIESVRAPGTGK